MKPPAWRTDKPAPGRVVEVWFLTTVILAAWTGNEWRTADGDRLSEITHWRERA